MNDVLMVINKGTNPIREKILKGMELTYTRLIKSKKERNLDLVVTKKGEIVRILAKDLDTRIRHPEECPCFLDE